MTSLRLGVCACMCAIAVPNVGSAQSGADVYGGATEQPTEQPAEQQAGQAAPDVQPAPAPAVEPTLEEPDYLGEEPEAPRNNVFAEAFGAGLWYSLNYERILVPSLAVRVGFSFLSASFGGIDRTQFLSIPVTAHLLLNSSRRNQFDVSLGATMIWASNLNRLSNLLDPGAGAVVWGTAGLGYRIQPRRTGFHFRVGGGALFGKGIPMGLDLSAKRGLLPWIYVGAGASF